MTLQASPELLIQQWKSSPKIYGIAKGIIDIWEGEVVSAFETLEKMHHVDTATGGWLDLIGIRLGIERPSILGSTSDKKFGFKNVTKARGFDQKEYKGVLSDEARYPLADNLFRKIIKARGRALVSHGEFSGFCNAIQELDQSAFCTDNRNMSVTVETDEKTLMEMADKLGAIPRPVGVNIIYKPGRRWGFDEAGAGFDQVRYE